MSDLLKKISEAREKATANYLRELATNEIAVLVKACYPQLLEHAIQQVQRPDTEFKTPELCFSATKLLHRSMLDYINESPSDPTRLKEVGGEQMIAIARSLWNDPQQRARFERVHQHVSSFWDMAASLGNGSQVKTEKVIKAAAHFHAIFRDAVDRAETMFVKEQRSHIPKEIVAFEGGGMKGNGHIGAWLMMEQLGKTDDVKYIAGTSAGGIVGMAAALGFRGRDLESIMSNGQFAQFFSESSELFKMVTKSGVVVNRWLGTLNPEKVPYLEGFHLVEFGREFMLPVLEEMTGIERRTLLAMRDHELNQVIPTSGPLAEEAYARARDAYENKLISSSRENELDVLKFGALPGRSPEWQACVHAVRALRPDSHPEPDLIESYFGDLVEIALTRHLERNPDSPALRNCKTPELMRMINFTKLQELALETDYKVFKELGVAVTESHAWRLSWVPRACKNAMLTIRSLFGDKPAPEKGYGAPDLTTTFQPHYVRAGGGEYLDMPIKKGVRSSMNLPVVFSSIDHEGRKIIDGGMNSNFPYRIFLDKFETVKMAEEKTFGFKISTVDSDMEYASIDSMARVAKKEIDVELDKYKKTLAVRTINIKDESLKFLKKIGCDLLTLNIGNAVARVAAVMLAPLGKLAGHMIEAQMNKHNATLPSTLILDNTGIISTGMVGTADFHLGQDYKSALLAAGKRAALSVISNQTDRHLRFARDRLVSLIGIENELLRKEGKQAQVVLPQMAFHDHTELSKAIIGSYKSEVKLGDLMAGSIPAPLKRAATLHKPKVLIIDGKKKQNDDGELDRTA